jgi:hypothetical protein
VADQFEEYVDPIDVQIEVDKAMAEHGADAVEKLSEKVVAAVHDGNRWAASLYAAAGRHIIRNRLDKVAVK